MSALLDQAGRKSIAAFDLWLQSPLGRRVLTWELMHADRVLEDVFGFHALQIGLPTVNYLRANRMTLRFTIGCEMGHAVCCDPIALPIASQSIDLVVLPHLLEFHDEPHQILREVERVLRPEGQILIFGFNPLSLWGIRRKLTNRKLHSPWNGDYLSLPRLKDWLKLLGFEIDRGAFGVYCPPFSQEKWLRHTNFLEAAGDRWWGFAGAVYLLRAIKRVSGLRLIGPRWRNKRLRASALRPAIEKHIQHKDNG